MPQKIRDVYLAAVALGAVAIFGTIISLPSQLPDIQLVRPISVQLAQEFHKIVSFASGPCTEADSQALQVGGLYDAQVPQFPTALRLSYDTVGTSAYVASANERQVFEYYLPQLAQDCWNISSLQPNEAVWSKDGQTLRVAVAQNPLGGKSVINYELGGGQVLGYRFPQDGSANTATPDGTTENSAAGTQAQPTTQPAIPILCPVSQFRCNQSCVDKGTLCNGYTYFKTGTGSLAAGQVSTAQKQDIQAPGKTGSRVDEKRLASMKKDLTQFSKGATQIKSLVQQIKPQLDKAGVQFPPELLSALAKSTDVVNQLKTAQSSDQVTATTEDITDVGSALKEWGPKLGQLIRLATMLKMADQQLLSLQQQVAKFQKNNTTDTGSASIISQLDALVQTMKQTLSNAKTLAKTEPDSALDTLNRSFYGQMEEYHALASQVETIQNPTNGITQAKQAVTRAEQRIRTIEASKKIDKATLDELKTLIAALKTKLATLQSSAKTTNQDVVQKKQEAEGFWQQDGYLENKLDELGQGFYESTAQAGKNVDFKLPASFEFVLPAQPAQGSSPSNETSPTPTNQVSN